MSVRVYAIRNRSSLDTYIGTTTKQYLSDRMSGHRYAYRKELGGDTTRPCMSHKVLACPTAYIELLETCDKAARKSRERWWIENTPNCVNKQLPGRTTEEYQETHADHLRETQRIWRAENREVILAKKRAHYAANKEQILAQQREHRRLTTSV